MWEQYHTPASLSEALSLLAQHGPAARVVAGGTDLILEIERGQISPRILVDITRIPGLDQIRLADGLVHVGPLVTHNQAVASELLVERAFPLAAACWEVGAPQIRNQATIGGNLVTATPASDTISPLWALGATVKLLSIRGERTLAFPEFFRGMRKTLLQPDELLVDISFRPLSPEETLSPEERGTFIKLGPRKSQAISMVNITAILGFDRDTVRTAQITLGSVAPMVVAATQAAAFLLGRRLDEETIQEAGRLAVTAATPRDSVRSPAAYRSEMVHALTVRALRQLRDRTERAAWPQRPAMLWGASAGHRTAAQPAATLHTAGGDEPIELSVNGRRFSVLGANDKTLLQMLREDIGLTGSKEGCGEGECGACTVFLDGMAVMACLVPAPAAHASQVVTIEGLARGEELHPLQEAFIAADAVQCGYCTPGFIMSGAKLLEELAHPTRSQIEQAISGNLCRCTGYVNIVRAIELAAAHGHEPGTSTGLR